LTPAQVLAVYNGSDGEATRALYARLDQLGTVGAVAVNVFRALKTSERAKIYRGGQRGRGSYRGMAYDRKSWSIDNLAKILAREADDLGLIWGWKRDPSQPRHDWILYIDLPTGQVSYHTAPRGEGPDYLGQWDSIRAAGPDRISRWISELLTQRHTSAPPEQLPLNI
jgi:hypothetical protein